MKYKRVIVEYEDGSKVKYEEPIAISIWTMEDVDLMLANKAIGKTNYSKEEALEYLRRKLNFDYLHDMLEWIASEYFYDILRGEITSTLQGGD